MKDEIIEILAMICPTLDFDDEDLCLAENMESVDLDSLISELEDKYDIEISADEKTEENFANIDTLIDMINRLQ